MEGPAIIVAVALAALAPMVGPTLVSGLRQTVRESAPQAPAKIERPHPGRNPKPDGSRTNTDAGPGGSRAVAKSIYINRAEGKR